MEMIFASVSTSIPQSRCFTAGRLRIKQGRQEHRQIMVAKSVSLCLLQRIELSENLMQARSTTLTYSITDDRQALTGPS